MGFLGGGGGGGSPMGDPLNLFGTRGPFGGGDPSTNGGALNQALSGGNTPQQQGYGISDTAPFTPWQPVPGLQPGQGYNPSMDLSGPGAAEAYWQHVQGNTPASLDPYYARARARTSADMNNQLAARGQFGSTAGMGMLGNALSNLSAEQANREADYALRQMGQMGSLAGQAQSAQQGRLGDLFGYNMALGDRANRNYMDQMNALLSGDQNAMQAAMMAEQGLAQQALAQGYRTPQRILDESKQAEGLLGGALLGGIL